ncbi:MAG: YjbH domain-containing protein [Fimbriimonadaceae bacterium]|nr:YjbH domain-containing protein [Fimbriimonadaceae bacterium]
MIRSRSLSLIATTLVAATVGAQPGAGPLRGDRFAQTSSMGHYTGLLRIPSAYTAGDGEFRLSYGSFWTNTFRTGSSERISILSASLGFLPYTEVGIGAIYREKRTFGTFDDRAVSGKASVPVGKGARIAIGSTDLNGTRKFATDYVVGSAPIGRANVTLGTGNGEFDGVFGGVAYPLSPRLAAVAEYDGRGSAAGLKFLASDRVSLAVGLSDKGELGASATVSVPLHGREPDPDPTLLSRVLSRNPMSVKDPIAYSFLQKSLVEKGLQDVRIGLDGTEMVVSYANGVFRDELLAMRYVLEQACELAPAAVQRVKIVPHREGVGVVQVSVGATDYLDFANGVSEPADFAKRLVVQSFDGRRGAPVELAEDRRNPSAGSLDVAVSPRVNYQLGRSEIPNKESVVVDGYAPLGGGFAGFARARTVVSNNLDSERGTRLEQTTADYAWTSRSGAFGRVSAGWFGDLGAGLAADLTYLIDGGAYELFAAYGTYKREGKPSEDAYRVGAGVRVPQLDLRVRASANRYLGGDTGPLIEATRRFRDGDVTLFLGETRDDAQKVRFGGVQLSIPMGTRYPKPGRVRLRQADAFDFGYTAVEDGVPFGGTHRTMPMARTVNRDLLARETLVPAYIEANVASLRNPRRNRRNDG